MSKIKEYLPAKFRRVPVWRDYANVTDEKVMADFRDALDKLLQLRNEEVLSETLLTRTLRLLGFFIDTDLFNEEQLRLLIRALPLYYEKRATKSALENLLSYLLNLRVELEELYADDDAPFEIIGAGDNTTRTFVHTALVPPLVPESVQITDGAQTITDDGNGHLRIGDTFAGNVDYLTGRVECTFSVPPVLNAPIRMGYKTRKYQTFYSELEFELKQPAGYPGPSWYLTSHVNLLIDWSCLRIDRLVELFYYLAPAVVVLNTIALKMRFVSTITVQGAMHHTIRV